MLRLKDTENHVLGTLDFTPQLFCDLYFSARWCWRIDNVRECLSEALGNHNKVQTLCMSAPEYATSLNNQNSLMNELTSNYGDEIYQDNFSKLADIIFDYSW
jgi:hypothetical protein